MTHLAAVLAVALVISAGLSPVHAASDRSAADKMCKGGAAGVACLESALKSAEAALEAAATKARGVLNAGALQGEDLKQTLALFDAAHAQWLQFRNSECEAHERYDTALGAGGPPTRLACLLNETLARQKTMNVRFSSE